MHLLYDMVGHLLTHHFIVLVGLLSLWIMPCHGFSSIYQNEVRDLTVELLSYVCHKVEVEPKLQPLNNETFQYKTANTQYGARLDISMNGFLGSCFEVFHQNKSF